MKPKPKTLDEALAPRGSMSALARRLGISVSFLCEIRKRRRVPKVDLALRIVQETGIPVESLTGERVS